MINRKFCWVYQDKVTGDLKLVQRPHRRAYGPMYRMLGGVFRRNGARPDSFLGLSVRNMFMGEFLNRYSFVGRLR